MDHADCLAEIARRLRELRATSPTNEGDVEAWSRQAREFSHWLSNGPPLELPAQLMHYLHDADIRARDPEYRATQERMIGELIAAFERGDVPASTGKNFTLTLAQACFWLAGAIVVLGALVMGGAIVLRVDPEWGYLAMAAIVLAIPVGLLGVVVFWLANARR